MFRQQSFTLRHGSIESCKMMHFCQIGAPSSILVPYPKPQTISSTPKYHPTLPSPSPSPHAAAATQNTPSRPQKPSALRPPHISRLVQPRVGARIPASPHFSKPACRTASTLQPHRPNRTLSSDSIAPTPTFHPSIYPLSAPATQSPRRRNPPAIHRQRGEKLGPQPPSPPPLPAEPISRGRYISSTPSRHQSRPLGPT